MGKFRELVKETSGTDALVDNFRPVQQLNERTVYVTGSAQTINAGGGPGGHLLNMALIASGVAVIISALLHAPY